MITFKNLWERLVDPENIKLAILNACKRKTKRKCVQKALADVNGLSLKISALLKSGDFYFHKSRPKLLKGKDKDRVIVRPAFSYDQIVHHAIVQVFKDVVLRSAHPNCCGSIPGRGTSYAKKRIEKHIRQKKPKYYFQMDVKRFFGSIDREELMKMLSGKIHDHKFLNLLRQLLETNDDGLPLGYYTSQWLANFFLTPLDHLIASDPASDFVLRYMDDVVIFGNNKRKLAKLKEKISEWLKGHKLSLKENAKLNLFCRENGMDLDFLGFRFKEGKTILRARLFVRIRRKSKRFLKNFKKKNVSAHEAASLASYNGWMGESDCHWFKNGKDFKMAMRKAKKVLSKQEAKP